MAVYNQTNPGLKREACSITTDIKYIQDIK